VTKTIAIIQARMASSRLPDKVLLDIAGRPMLEWVVERTQRAKLVDEVIVATTTDQSDDPVAFFCSDNGYAFTRGSVHNVLDRYYQAARPHNPDSIVRITADCPLLDPTLVDETIRVLLGTQLPISNHQSLIFDFAANRLPLPWGRTYPIGLDVEVFSWDALQRAWHEAEMDHQREHVTPYFYEDIPAEELRFTENSSSPATANSPREFRIALLHYKRDLGHLRWTVDTAEDLSFVRQVISRLDHADPFTWLDVLALLHREPELMRINIAVQHKTHLDVDDRSS
jgi:spore coat polysaccharide biosynthesis protein SpsF